MLASATVTAMRPASLAISIIVSFVSTNPVEAQPACRGSAPELCFARDAIQSLAAAHRGAVRPDITGARGSVVAIAQAIMYASRRQEAALVEARRVIAPYTSAADSAVSDPAILLDVSFQVLAEFQSTAVAALRDQLDGRGGGRGSAAEKLADLQLQRREAAEGLIAAAGGIAQSLIGPADMDGRHRSLIITAEERNELLLALKDGFGAAMTPNNGQYGSDYAVAAVTLRTFLTDPGWQAAAPRRR